MWLGMPVRSLSPNQSTTQIATWCCLGSWSHSGSNRQTRKNQAALMQQRFFSLLFCWFIQAIIVPATQGTAIPQKQNSQTQWSTWNTTLLEERAQNIMVHFRVAVTCVPQPGTCSAMPATGDDHVVRLQISSLGKAEIAIQCWNSVWTHLLIDAGFDSYGSRRVLCRQRHSSTGDLAVP